MPSVPRIVALDDHPILVEGIVTVLTRQSVDFEWCGTYTRWDSLARILDEGLIDPTICLVDLHLGDGSEPSTIITDLTRRGIKCLILTSERRPIPIRQAVSAGAVGLVLKADPPERLSDAVIQLQTADFVVSSDMAFLLISDETLCPSLSPKEIEVLELLAEGYTRSSVARRLDPPVAESTVSTHTARAMAKYRELGQSVNSTVDMLRAATRDGYLSANDAKRHPI